MEQPQHEGRTERAGAQAPRPSGSGPNGSHGDVVLKLDGVTRRYGGLRAVDGLSLSVRRGERRVIIGPNGAGKTTLFKMISRLETVSEGRIELFGADITKTPSRKVARLGLARTYQITQIFPQLPVIENVMVAVQALERRKFAMLRAAMRQRSYVEKAQQALERVRLADFAQALASELGHGQQRQLELAIALARDPRILLLDEPSSGLSGSDRGLIRELVRALPQEITVLLIEHDMDLALGLADYVTCMHNGATVADGTPQEIRSNQRVQDIYLGKAAE